MDYQLYISVEEGMGGCVFRTREVGDKLEEKCEFSSLPKMMYPVSRSLKKWASSWAWIIFYGLFS